MNRYVKKPIAIEAVKWKGFNNDEIKDFAGDSVKIEVIREGDADNGIPPSVDCSIETLEGVMKANVGDYIIKGVNGEFYPCKQDIFEKTYLHEDDMGNISDGYHTFNELYKFGMTNINPAVNIITNNADISFIIFRSIVSLIISPQL